MKLKHLSSIVVLLGLILNCSGNVEYSEEFKKQTTGDYLFNQDDVISVYYTDNTLFLNWRGGKIEPVAIEENEFFVPDLYKKFHFVVHPETGKRYLSALSEDENAPVTYDFPKAPNGYKTPSTHLSEGNYEKALAGYLKIKENDSTSEFINEWEFNKMGYKHIRNKDYDKAIGVLKINASLHPTSANVYDSLAHAYLLNGDSLKAYINYKKTLEKNNQNKRAQAYVNSYQNKRVTPE